MRQVTDRRALAVARHVAAACSAVSACRSGGLARRFIRFGVIGAGGMVVNTILFAAATEFRLSPLAAAFLSMEIATAFNFIVLEKTVFQGRGHGWRWARMMSFFGVATAGFLVTGPVMILLISGALPPVLANIAAIGSLMVVRFAIADRIIWSSGRKRQVSARREGCRTVRNPLLPR
jgi:putative flippase GtrA